MPTEILLYLGIFLAGFAVFWFVLSLFQSKGDSQALSWATGDQPQKSSSPVINYSRPLVHQFTIQHAHRVKSVEYREKVENLILTSGLDEELNVDEFIGLQMLWGVVAPIFSIIINFALQLGYPPEAILLMIPFGLLIPKMYASTEKKKRQHSALLDLPFFIDLLALSTEAGLDFIGAIQKIVDKSPGTVLSVELNKVIRDIRIGSSREKALRDFAKRLDMSEISSFTNVVIDADATGASIASVLKEQSIQMRLERFVRAEKAGAKASQAIMLPLVFFIVPAVFIVIGAPMALQFKGGGQ